MSLGWFGFVRKATRLPQISWLVSWKSHGLSTSSHQSCHGCHTTTGLILRPSGEPPDPSSTLQCLLEWVPGAELQLDVGFLWISGIYTGPTLKIWNLDIFFNVVVTNSQNLAKNRAPSPMIADQESVATRAPVSPSQWRWSHWHGFLYTPQKIQKSHGASSFLPSEKWVLHFLLTHCPYPLVI